MLLALKRHVSSTSDHLKIVRSTLDSSNKLKFEKEKSDERASSESMVTSSEASMKEDVSEQDSGLEIDEIYGLKEEIQELKLENDKLQSEILTMTKQIESQIAMIEEKEENLQGSKRKCRTFEDQSSMLTLQVEELCERRRFLEEELRIREDQLEEMEAKNAEAIMKLNEEHNKKMIIKVLKIEKLEKIIAKVKKNNSELNEELKEKDRHIKEKEIENDASLQAMKARCEEETQKTTTEKDKIVNELVKLKKGIKEETAKSEENEKELKAIKKACELLEDKKAVMAAQLKEISTVSGRLEHELALKCKELRCMEARYQEELKKLKENHSAEMSKKERTIEQLQKEISKCRDDYAELKKILQEKDLEVQAKLMAKDAMFGAMESTYEGDAEAYQTIIQELQRKMGEEEKWKASHIETEKLMIHELAKANQKVVDLRNAKDESDKEKRWLNYKIDELTTRNAEVRSKFLDEQERRKSIHNLLKDEIKDIEKEHHRLEECKSALEEEASEYKMQLKSRESKIADLERELYLLNVKLSVKESIIDQFLKEKPKKRGIKKFFSCGR